MNQEQSCENQQSFRGCAHTSQPALYCWMRDAFLVWGVILHVDCEGLKEKLFCSSCLKLSASFTALSTQPLMTVKVSRTTVMEAKVLPACPLLRIHLYMWNPKIFVHFTKLFLVQYLVRHSKI